MYYGDQKKLNRLQGRLLQGPPHVKTLPWQPMDVKTEVSGAEALNELSIFCYCFQFKVFKVLKGPKNVCFWQGNPRPAINSPQVMADNPASVLFKENSPLTAANHFPCKFF